MRLPLAMFTWIPFCLFLGAVCTSCLMLSSLLLCAGDMGVGKSCLLHQFTEKKCKPALTSLPHHVL